MSHRSHPAPGTGTGTSNAPRPRHPPTPTSLSGASSPSYPLSRNSSRSASLDPKHNGHSKQNGFSKGHSRLRSQDDGCGSDSDADEGEGTMDSRRTNHHRALTGERSNQPLLHTNKDYDERERDRERGRSGYNSPSSPHAPPFLSRRSTMRSRSPETQAKLETRKKYTYAAFFLGLSLISFVIQTETAVYIQHELGWNKAYCMLYLTHGSWSLLWPFQLLILRIQKWNMPWHTFWRRHVYLVRTTAQMVELQDLTIPRGQRSPIPYMLRMTAFVTCALTVAGGSWYVAVNLTSPSDLTAIYNCSAFFAYAFSVPILKEKLRFDKSFAVLVAIIGVLVVAYGDATPTKHGGKSGGSVGGGEQKEAENRVLGNLIIGVGSVLYGLYEVLYKRLACPPEGVSPGRGMIFANTFGSLIGSFTLLVLWIPLPILHILGWEKFELPHGQAAWLMAISVLANATFSGSFLVLISLTSPVLSSVAALLTIFLVAIVDWMWTGIPLSPAAIAGGLLIIAAFLLLSWSTYREMTEERRRKGSQADLIDDDSDKDSVRS